MDHQFFTIKTEEGSCFEWFYFNFAQIQEFETCNYSGVMSLFLIHHEGKKSAFLLNILTDLNKQEVIKKSFVTNNFLGLLPMFLETSKTTDRFKNFVKKFISDHAEHVDHLIDDSVLEYDLKVSKDANNSFEINCLGSIIKGTENNVHIEYRVSDDQLISADYIPLIQTKDVFHNDENAGTLSYLTMPMCKVDVRLLDSKIHEIDAIVTYKFLGIGHIDHQWFDYIKQLRPQWNWISCLLDNGSALYFYQFMFDGMVKYDGAEIILFNVDNTVKRYKCTINILREWVSPITFVKYPVELELTTSDFKVVIKSAFNNQEICTNMIHTGYFYEGTGHCTMISLKDSNMSDIYKDGVKGKAFLEFVQEFKHVNRLTECFKDARLHLKEGIMNALPEKCTLEQYIQLLQIPDKKEFVFHGVHECQGPRDFERNTTSIMRYCVGEGGSGWRSGFALALVYALTDSQVIRDLVNSFVPFVEILQAASLALDDIQDGAETRRGEICAYKIFEQNTLTMAIIQMITYGWPALVYNSTLPDRIKAKSVHTVLTGISHVNQGQHDDLARETHIDSIEMQALLKGDITVAVENITRINALKTGTFISMFFKFVAVVSTDDEELQNICYDLGLNLGMYFQIMNDTFDYGSEPAKLGEDIRCRKLTLPFVYAVGNMSEDQRIHIINQLCTGDVHDEKVMHEIVRTVVQHGGLDACKNGSEQVITDLVTKLAERIPTSAASLRLCYYLDTFLTEFEDRVNVAKKAWM